VGSFESGLSSPPISKEGASVVRHFALLETYRFLIFGSRLQLPLMKIGPSLFLIPGKSPPVRQIETEALPCQQNAPELILAGSAGSHCLSPPAPSNLDFSPVSSLLPEVFSNSQSVPPTERPPSRKTDLGSCLSPPSPPPFVGSFVFP